MDKGGGQKPVLLVSLDVETLGRIPGLHSMLSIGAAAFRADGVLEGTFERNVEPLGGMSRDEATEAWWRDPCRQQAWKHSIRGADPAYAVMQALAKWMLRLRRDHEIELVAKPAGFDMGFLEYYMERFAGVPLSERWRCWDLHSLIAALIGGSVNHVRMSHLPAELLAGLERPGEEHTALSDAIYQGRVAQAVLKALRRRIEIQSLIQSAARIVDELVDPVGKAGDGGSGDSAGWLRGK